MSCRLAFAFVASLALLSLPSCHSSPQDVCKQEIPRYQERIKDAMIALQPWMDAIPKVATQGDGRKPASLAPDVRARVMADIDRGLWTKWAETKLSEMQRYMDLVEERRDFKRAFRPALQDAATQMVLFYGFAETGDVPKMVATLETVLKDCEKISESCAEGDSSQLGTVRHPSQN